MNDRESIDEAALTEQELEINALSDMVTTWANSHGESSDVAQKFIVVLAAKAPRLFSPKFLREYADAIESESPIAKQILENLGLD